MQIQIVRSCFIASLAFWFQVTSAQAEQLQTFTVDPQASQIQFLLNSAMFPIEGRIDRFQGKLHQDRNAPNKISIQFDCDLSSVKLSQAQLAGLPISDLLASVQKSSAHFEGSSVGLTKKGSIQMNGLLKWKGKSYPVKFPVHLEGSGNMRAISGEISGEGQDLVTEIPALALLQVQSASANAKIRFKK